MLSLENISYEVPSREVFSNVSFTLNKGEKVGLVGPNGVGKTTLLNVIAGNLEPTSGQIIKDTEAVGILPQDLRDWLDRSVYGFIEEVTGVKEAREEFDKQCAKLTSDVSDRTLLLYEEALDKFNKLDVAGFDTNLEKALTLADIPGVDPAREIGSFSGGQRTRIALAAIFASRYDTLLLDEPTNNLDERGIVVLERFVGNSNAAFLMVSHDRRFLRNVTSRIIELMGGDQGVRQYGLGYDEYVEAREKAKEAVLKRYEEYDKEKKRLKKSAREAAIRANSASSTSNRSDNDKLNANFRKEKAASGLSRTAQNLAARFDRLEEPERPEEAVSLDFLFKESNHKKVNLLTVSDLTVSYDGRKVIGPTSFHIRSGDKLLLQGENGAGKSSIIRAIIGHLAASSGTVRLNKDAGLIYIDQNQTLPQPDKSALANLRHMAPSLEVHDAINLLVRFNLNKQTLSTTPAHSLSGGERAKVLLAAIAANSAGLLIMDEPTNNLDIPTIEALERALGGYRGGVLLVSHDRDFLSKVGPTNSIRLFA